MILYLVINTESPEEPYVLDICKSEEQAECLKDRYINNFITIANRSSCDFIVIEKIDTDSNNSILWSMYH